MPAIERLLPGKGASSRVFIAAGAVGRPDVSGPCCHPSCGVDVERHFCPYLIRVRMSALVSWRSPGLMDVMPLMSALLEAIRVARRLGSARTWVLAAVVTCSAFLVTAPAAARTVAAGSYRRPVISPITEFSKGCAGQNAEVEQAADPVRGLVYEEWMGCDNRIGVAVSTDGGLHFSSPVVLADSVGAWDPSIAVAPNGTVYAAFMNATAYHTFPVVEASFNHGKTFPRVVKVVAKKRGNWGDRDFIAVGPLGTVYLTWDYGPSAKDVRFICSTGGSCSFASGDLNIVMQKSTDGGRHWGPMTHVSPGFPAGGGDSAPLLVEPDGKIYVEYQGYHMTSRTKFTMSTAHSFVTSSASGGTTWSAPVRIGPARLSMNKSEWWIDGDISADSAGNLYVTWDTQVGGHDIGWLAYSTDHGKHWSALRRVTPDTDNATHIVQVVGGSRGIAYVGWLADNSPHGYALYLRPFSIRTGWLSGPIRVSRTFGNPAVWPGDTFGISLEPALPATSAWQLPPAVVVSWGSAVGGKHADSQDRAAIVTF